MFQAINQITTGIGVQAIGAFQDNVLSSSLGLIRPVLAFQAGGEVGGMIKEFGNGIFQILNVIVIIMLLYAIFKVVLSFMQGDTQAGQKILLLLGGLLIWLAVPYAIEMLSDQTSDTIDF